MSLAKHRNRRRPGGNMLVLIVSTMLIITGVILFAMWWLSSGQSFHSHETAIESAALAAARDCGRIVIDTPEFGYVSLCDEAPIGTNTKANDNYFVHVKSINEMLATARVDAIIADEVGDAFIKKMADKDADDILKAKNALVTAIKAAILPGGKGKDINGADVMPYDDALNMYRKNEVATSKYVANSMKLDLGGFEGGVATAVPIPNPPGYANTTEQINGFYRSEKNISYGGKDYVFASCGVQAALLDPKKWKATVPGLPYQNPAVILVTAKQEFYDQDKKWQVDYAAAASPGRAIRSPSPGALAFSFPDGLPGEVLKINDMRTWKELDKSADLLTAENGDFPVDKGAGARITDSPIPWASPWSGLSAPCHEVIACAIYDWLRAGGATAHVDDIKNEFARKWTYPNPPKIAWKTLGPDGAGGLKTYNLGQIPNGIQHRYEFKPDGRVDYTSPRIKPQPYIVAAESQLYAENPGSAGGKQALLAKQANNIEWGILTDIYMPTDTTDINPAKWPYVLKPNVCVVGTPYYDMYVRDMLRQPGKIKGGKHDGTPMDGKIFVGWKDDFGSGGRGCGSRSDGDGRDGDGGSGSGTGGVPPNAPPNTGGGGVGNTLSGLGLPPMVSRQDDFATSSTMVPRQYLGYTTGPGGGAERPTYTVTGTTADIRLRREIDLGQLGIIFGNATTGYVGVIED